MLMHLLALCVCYSHGGSNDKPTKQYDYDMLLKNLRVCNNSIVRDISGGSAAVLKAGKLYIEDMRTKSRETLEPFNNRWRKEFDRVLGPYMDPQCSSLRVFGDEAKNYDEAKRFCYLHSTHDRECSVYSIGSSL